MTPEQVVEVLGTVRLESADGVGLALGDMLDSARMDFFPSRLWDEFTSEKWFEAIVTALEGS